VYAAVRAAEAFLMAAQDSDGFWRDYSLPPGPSTGWSSACIAWSLVNSSLSAELRRAVERSRVAIHSHRLSGGWGYNFEGEPDADTTAWVLRLMAKLSDPCARDAARYLEPFLSESGGVRTFSTPKRFGTWAHEHIDVTPTVGLALVENASGEALIARLRAWCLAKQRPDGGWDTFWWSTDSYAVARNLEFLNSSGGIPANVVEGCWRWLFAQGVMRSSFEGAHLLLSAIFIGAMEEANCLRLVSDLLASQLSDGSWPASPVLQVPHQWDDEAEILLYDDCKRLMSTAMVLRSLSSWLRAVSSDACA
jgi:hypothetical protein